MVICARCKQPWAGDTLFITCPSCRIPEAKKPRKHYGCRRWESCDPSSKRFVPGDTKPPAISRHIINAEVIDHENDDLDDEPDEDLNDCEELDEDDDSDVF